MAVPMFNRKWLHARFAVILVTILITAAPATPFISPLTEESVRDAYFLGQRRGTPVTEFLAQYQKDLAEPASGPWISYVKFLTPFAQLVSYSSQQMNYNAQQAVIDHKDQREFVSIEILIQFTKSYPALIAQPAGSRSGTTPALMVRPGDFWKSFRAQVSVGKNIVESAGFTGKPNYICDENGCALVGATLYMEVPAENVNADSVAVHVFPPEGSEMVVEFAAGHLR
jgi:hypothetical protein